MNIMWTILTKNHIYITKALTAPLAYCRLFSKQMWYTSFPQNINMNSYLCNWCPTKNTSCSKKFVMNGVSFMKYTYISKLCSISVYSWQLLMCCELMVAYCDRFPRRLILKWCHIHKVKGQYSQLKIYSSIIMMFDVTWTVQTRLSLHVNLNTVAQKASHLL